MKRPLDLTKPLQTRLGQPVRVLATDLRRDNKVELLVVAVMVDEGYETLGARFKDGRVYPEGDIDVGADIINVTEDVTAIVHIYRKKNDGRVVVSVMPPGPRRRFVDDEYLGSTLLVHTVGDVYEPE
jgi:hypothetical protein